MIPLAAAGLFAGKMAATGLFSSQKANSTISSAKLFDKFDQKKSGDISLDEFLSAGQKVPGGKNGADQVQAKKLFEKIDGNGDGKITKDEAKAFDDKISKIMQDAMTKLQELLGGTSGANAGASGSGMLIQIDSSGGHPSKLSDLFSKIDTNSDNKVDAKEFKAFGRNDVPMSTEESAAADKIFAAMDTNKDGALTKDEIKAFEEKNQNAAGGSGDLSGVKMTIVGNGQVPPTSVTAKTSGTAKTDQVAKLLEALSAYDSKNTKKSHRHYDHIQQPDQTASTKKVAIDTGNDKTAKTASNKVA